MSGLALREHEVPNLLRSLGIAVRPTPAEDGTAYSDSWVIACPDPQCGSDSAQLMLSDETAGELLIYCIGCQTQRRSSGWRRYSVAEFVRLYVGSGSARSPGLPRLEMTADPAAASSWASLADVIGPIRWEWDGWLPRGLLTMLVSASGLGKSIAALRIAACPLRGDSWPDGSEFSGTLGKVLWCEAEAAQAVNLGRAKTWGLPLDFILTPLSDPLEGVVLDEPSHRDSIAAIAGRDDVRLVVVDSLSGGNRRDENASAMLTTVTWLAELARDVAKPLLLLHHLRKSRESDPDPRYGLDLERVRGSSSIVQPARVIWGMDLPSGPNSDVRRLAQIKNNLRRFPDPLGMVVTEDGRVIFGDAPEPHHLETAESRAADFLLRLLDRTPVLAAEILSEAEAAGIPTRTLYRAKARLRIASPKVDGRWFWSLPPPEGSG